MRCLRLGVIHETAGDDGTSRIKLNEVKELASKLGDFVGNLELQDTLEHLHVLFPLPLPPRLLFFSTAAGPVASTDFHAVGTQVIFLAVGALARWMCLYAVLADIHGAGLAFPEVAWAPLALIPNSTILRAEKGLASLPPWRFEGRLG